MTNASIALREDVIRPARRPRTASTLRLHLLMEERQRLEIGARIKELRERSPWTQPEVAEKLGIKLRGYQKLEKEGTERFSRCEEIYDIHKDWVEADPEWGFVSAGWIWDGRVRPKEKDLMASLEGPLRESARDEALEALQATLTEGLDRLSSELEELRQLLESGGRKRKGTSK